MSMKELLARVQVLEDMAAVRKLKATYCYLCDAGLGNARGRVQQVLPAGVLPRTETVTSTWLGKAAAGRIGRLS